AAVHVAVGEAERPQHRVHARGPAGGRAAEHLEQPVRGAVVRVDEHSPEERGQAGSGRRDTAQLAHQLDGDRELQGRRRREAGARVPGRAGSRAEVLDEEAADPREAAAQRADRAGEGRFLVPAQRGLRCARTRPHAAQVSRSPVGEAALRPSQRRSVASLSPSATSTAPVSASIARFTHERLRKSPARATAIAYAVSQTSVIRLNTKPSASSAVNECANCGSRLGKKAAIFGLPRLLSWPWRKARRGSSGRDRRGWVSFLRPRTAATSAWIPSQIRYAAPAILTARNAGSEAASRAAIPTAEAIVQIACPL